MTGSSIKHIKATNIFWAILSLYFLNISIDVNNSFSCRMPENLSYNKQESFIEILVEKVFGFENAIAEYDEENTDQNLLTKKNITIDAFVLPIIQININQFFGFENIPDSFFCDLFVKPAHREIHSPPPDFPV